MSKKVFNMNPSEATVFKRALAAGNPAARMAAARMLKAGFTHYSYVCDAKDGNSEALPDQLANAGNISGLSASTAGVSATVEGSSPRQPGEGIVQDDGVDVESLRKTIVVVEQILGAVKSVAAKRAGSGAAATGASTEDDQGGGGEGQANAAANATGESYDQTAPSLQNPNNAIAQRLDRDTKSFTGDEVEEAAANMLTKMGQDSAAHAAIYAGTKTDPFGEHAAASANAAARTAFDARARAQRAKVIGDLRSAGSAYAAGFRSKSGKGMDASQDTAEAAMRAAGIQIPRRGFAFVPG